MNGRELMISVGVVEEREEQDYLAVEFWDEKMGEESILRYIKTCHEMSCYKNGAILIINKDKDNEIRLITDVYSDRRDCLYVKARDINQDYELVMTRNLNSMEQIVTANRS